MEYTPVDLGSFNSKAVTDTGARTSAIHAVNIEAFQKKTTLTGSAFHGHMRPKMMVTPKKVRSIQPEISKHQRCFRRTYCHPARNSGLPERMWTIDLSLTGSS
jgi:hypothetical protein